MGSFKMRHQFKRIPLILALLGACRAQDLPVIHVPAESARVLREAYQRKIEADRAYANLERQAVILYATRPGQASSGQQAVVANDPLPGWESGCSFSEDFSVIVLALNRSRSPNPSPRLARTAGKHTTSENQSPEKEKPMFNRIAASLFSLSCWPVHSVLNPSQQESTIPHLIRCPS